MRAEPEHRGILALDIQGFGRLERTNLVRARMRTGLHRILGNAMTAAEIVPEHVEQTEYGDGVLVLLGPQVSKARLLHPVLPRLLSGLARYNRTAPDAARLRLRVVVHAGELLRDAHGITGEDLILAFRLLDAEVVRVRLARAAADLVLVVSDAIYQGIVKHGYGRIDPAVFHPVWVTAKEVSARAWLHVPGTDRQGMRPASAPVAATSRSRTSPLHAATPTLPAWVPPAVPAHAYVQGRVQGPV
jgi:hypothetical protein